MEDLISRQTLLEKKIRIPIARIVTEDKIIYRDVVFVKDIEELPSVDPEYKAVTAEDFAKIMSENTIWGFAVWHREALALMKERGFVICKRTM